MSQEVNRRIANDAFHFVLSGKHWYRLCQLLRERAVESERYEVVADCCELERALFDQMRGQDGKINRMPAG